MQLKITFNSPVILCFAALSSIVLVLDFVTLGFTTHLLFSTYNSSLLNLLTYLRFFTHVLGHVDWNHFIGNMAYILLIGPLLEEKYGAKKMIEVIAVTALVTGVINWALFPLTSLCGASGVCFAFILLSSFTSINEKEIPITFILVALIFLGQQVYEGLFVRDNIAHLAHIVGGIVGAVFGFALTTKKKQEVAPVK